MSADGRDLNGTEIKIELARLEERLDALRERADRDQTSSRQALELASTELARRLDLLNHAHQDAKEALTTYLPREVFDHWCEGTISRLHNCEIFNANLTGKMWIAGATILVLAAIIAALFKTVNL